MAATLDSAGTVKSIQQRRSATERAGHILAWRETDQTQAAYCAVHGINATTFSGWLASERRGGALAFGVGTADTASSLIQQVLPSQPRERALPTQSPAAARTLTAVAVNLPTAALMSAARSACLKSATNHTASAASTAPTPTPAPIPTPGIELTAGTRWRIGLTEAVSPGWIAGLLRALDDYDPNAHSHSHTHTHATAAGWGNPC